MRPVKRFLAYLIFREKGEELLFAFLAVVLFAAGWGFLGVLQDVLAKDPLVLADQAVYHLLQSLRTLWMDNVFVEVTELGDSFVNITLACTILLILLAKRCRRAAVFWTLGVLGGLLAVQLLKWTLHLPRPVDIYHGASAYGFPSGHTTMNVVLYGFLAIMMIRQIAGTWRWALFSTVVFIAFLIGFSRLYLGADWLSDVLGGYFSCSKSAPPPISESPPPSAKPKRSKAMRYLLIIFVGLVVMGVIISICKTRGCSPEQHAKERIA